MRRLRRLRQIILSACVDSGFGALSETWVRKWYGSKTAFTNFVRSELKEEVVRAMSSRRMFALQYVLLVSLPILSVSLEFFLALLVGGAPSESLISFFISQLVGLSLFWFASTLLVLCFLCDHFAARRWNHAWTLAVTGIIAACGGAGIFFAQEAYKTSCLDEAKPCILG